MLILSALGLRCSAANTVRAEAVSLLQPSSIQGRGKPTKSLTINAFDPFERAERMGVL
jgi:hypothetical protein